MNRPVVLFLGFALILFASSHSRAQVVEPPAQPAATPPAKIDPAIEKKALDLIEGLTEQAMNLHSPSNRMRAEVAVADLLWTRDEKRARSLFTAALAQLVARIGELDYSDPEVYSEVMRVTQIRQELLLRIAAHDPELAISGLKQTRLPDNNSRAHGGWNLPNEAGVEIALASPIAEKDPAAALKLARSALTHGGTANVISFLPQLSQKDTAAARTLYQETVAKIKDENLARNMEMVNNAWNLLSSFQPPQADEDTYRDLLTTTLGYMLSINRDTQTGMNLAQNAYYQLERIRPLVEKYAPARAAELRTWSRSVERTVDPQLKMYDEVRKLSEHATVDEMLAAGEKYPFEFQNLLYQNAAWKAFTNGDTARAKEIIDMIPDPIQRRQMLDQIENQTASALEGNNKIIEARRLAEKARTIDRKIDVLIQVAGQLAAAGDKKGSLDLLNEAKALVASTPPSAAQFNAQLRLAQAYLKLDTDQSFVLLQPVIAKANELVAAAVVLDGIDFRYLKDGEWQMPGANNLGTMVNSIDQMLATLGQTDFDRARALTDQIERPEVRLLMQIDLAQTALGIRAVISPPLGGRIVFNGMMIIRE